MRRPAPIAALLFAAPLLHAQQTVAPTDATVGPPRGEDSPEYNVVNSFETGYRFRSVHGDLGKYRSDVNFGNGIRLLGSTLSVNSRQGHGRLFDELSLTTLGLGNDPYQSSTLRLQKNKLYRYDMLWRLNEYFNPGLAVAGGQHLTDTRRRLQDHDFTFLPQSKFNLRLGYSRDSQSGPALSTIQLFDPRGDEFPLFTNIRRQRNEYRVGGGLEVFRIKINWLRAWDNFKEDTPYFQDAIAGNNPSDPTLLTRFRRFEPYHGNSPLWRLNLRTERRLWEANGRLSYVGGRRNFVLDDTALGTNRFGAELNRQVLVVGNARRPVTAGDFLFTFFPSAKLTVSNNTSVYNIRMDGDASYREFSFSSLDDRISHFRFLGIRTVSNSTDLIYRVTPWVSLHTGYHFSNRLFRSEGSVAFEDSNPNAVSAEQENNVHAGRFGVRLKPVKPLTISLDTEVGRADRPFYPISERNYHTLGGRVQYRARSLTLAAAYRENFNNNSARITAFSSRGRNYSLNGSWTRRWFAVDAGYNKLHLNTLSGIAFFAAGSLVNSRSIYISNIHAGHLGATFTLSRRIDLYTGYSITRDTGDGRSGRSTDPLAAFVDAQTFPLSFASPLARVSVRLHPNLRWNAGYQFYHYKEDFGVLGFLQNYRAHTGYTSVLWSF